MKRININETFYNITKDDKNLRDVFIDMGFEPMRDEKTYQTVGRIITLKKAIAHINMSIDEVNTFLNSKNMEVELYE